MRQPRQVTTREEYEHLRRVALISKIGNDNAREIIYAFHYFIDSERFICSDCTSSLSKARNDLRAQYDQIKEAWEERCALEDVRRYMKGIQ